MLFLYQEYLSIMHRLVKRINYLQYEEGIKHIAYLKRYSDKISYFICILKVRLLIDIDKNSSTKNTWTSYSSNKKTILVFTVAQQKDIIQNTLIFIRVNRSCFFDSRKTLEVKIGINH